MYGTVGPSSGVAQVDGWCVGEGIARLFAPATFGILVDAEALPLRIGHVLTDATPEFAAAPLGAIAERHHIGKKARPVFDPDLAELTAL